MNELEALPSVVAKTLVLVGAVTDGWAAVGNYVGSAACANMLEVTPLECGQEMYCNVAWMICAAVRWVLPQLADLFGGLTLTIV